MNRRLTSMTKTVLLVSFIALSLNAFGQEQFGDIKQRIADYSRNYMQERVYLHFDNTSYNKGERMWYKANVVRGDDFTPTAMSKYLYVELLNPIGYPVVTQTLKIDDKGMADGSILLADTLNAGFYEVRAYTSWMLNFTPGDRHAWKKFNTADYKREYGERFQHFLNGNAGLFSRVFPVYGVDSDGVRNIGRAVNTAVADQSLKVEFYPEGGNIVDGVPAKIAFFAHNGAGRAADISGTIECDGKQIAVVSSRYEGRGAFIVPKQYVDCDKQPVMKVNYGGKNYAFDIPEAKKKGYTMTVAPTNGNYAITIARNERTKGKRLLLLATCRQQILHTETIDLTSAVNGQYAIPQTKMKTGVNIFTLLSDKGKVIAQRSVFVNNHDMDSYTINCTDTMADNMKPYQKVSLLCSVVDAKGRAMASDNTFSLSVRDAATTDKTNYTDNALTYLLLSSEIKGFVSNAHYYFESNDAAHAEALDHLLMVQGWTRYDFEQMADNKPFTPELAAEKNLMFNGCLYDINNRSEAAYWKKNKNRYWIYAEMLLGDSIVGYDVKPKNGKFSIPIPESYGGGYMWLNINRKSSAEIGKEKAGVIGHMRRQIVVSAFLDKAIKPKNAYSPLAKPYSYYETIAAEGSRHNIGNDKYMVASMDVDDMMTYLSSAYGRMMNYTSDSEIARQLLEILGIDGNSSFRRGDSPVVGDSAWYKRKVFMSEYTNLVYKNRPDMLCHHVNLYARNVDRTGMHSAAKHGETMNNGDFRNKYLPRGYRYYDENNPTMSHLDYIYYPIDVISISPRVRYSYPKSYYGFKTAIRGVEPRTEFYHCDYSQQPLPNEDHRRTLYWNPNVTTDKDGKAKIEFYNNSTCRLLVISAEGITKDGRAIVSF